MYTRYELENLMQDVKTNLETLTDRLKSLGYCFGLWVWDDKNDWQFITKNQEGRNIAPLTSPSLNIDKEIRYIEKNLGNLPLALQLFYKIVGGVNFIGKHPLWSGCEYPDPIVVDSLGINIKIFKAHEPEDLEDYFAADGYGYYPLSIGPDFYHKENVSGGMYYHIRMPNPDVDPYLEGESHNTTFINYLRICFKWGGFPGLEKAQPTHNWPLKELVRDLKPI